MSDPSENESSTVPPSVSHATVVAAAATCNALAQKQIEIEGVVFDGVSDTYHVVTPGGTVGDGDVRDGDDFDTQGVGGGNIKDSG